MNDTALSTAVRRTTKFLLGVPLILVAVTLVGSYIYGRLFLDFFQPGPLKTVDPAAWARIEIGMTREQVAALVGEPPAQYGPTVVKDAAGKTVHVGPRYWVYTWTEGLDLYVPSPKAHAVWFDERGKVICTQVPASPRR